MYKSSIAAFAIEKFVHPRFHLFINYTFPVRVHSDGP